jgi:hypothetical protein
VVITVPRYLAANDDVPVPLAGVRELLNRTLEAKQMMILRHADHQTLPTTSRQAKRRCER